MFLLQLPCVFPQEGSFPTTEPLCFTRNSWNSALHLLLSVLAPGGEAEWGLPLAEAGWVQPPCSPGLCFSRALRRDGQGRCDPRVGSLALSSHIP